MIFSSCTVKNILCCFILTSRLPKVPVLNVAIFTAPCTWIKRDPDFYRDAEKRMCSICLQNNSFQCVRFVRKVILFILLHQNGLHSRILLISFKSFKIFFIHFCDVKMVLSCNFGKLKSTEWRTLISHSYERILDIFNIFSVLHVQWAGRPGKN